MFALCPGSPYNRSPPDYAARTGGRQTIRFLERVRKERRPPMQNTPPPEKELSGSPIPLCTAGGQLNPQAVGWSRHPIHRCNLSGSWGRKKKWNYWCVTSPRHLFSITLSTLDYAGLAFTYFLDFETGRFHEQSVLVPLARGFSMPETVAEDVRFEHPKIHMSFRHDNGRVLLDASSPDFGGAPMRASLEVSYPRAHETLSVVVPWSESRFQYTSKHNTLPAQGDVEVFGTPVRFNRDETFACLDFGRGIWPYSSFWNWAAGSGRCGGRTIGLNLGAGWTDGTGSTENGVCVDGRMTKISEDLEFAYSPADFMKPWTIRTPRSAALNLTFTPFYERVAKSNVLLIRSEVHQCVGRFNGTLQTSEGESIDVRDLVGWAEEHHARW